MPLLTKNIFTNGLKISISTAEIMSKWVRLKGFWIKRSLFSSKNYSWSCWKNTVTERDCSTAWLQEGWKREQQECTSLASDSFGKILWHCTTLINDVVLNFYISSILLDLQLIYILSSRDYHFLAPFFASFAGGAAFYILSKNVSGSFHLGLASFRIVFSQSSTASIAFFSCSIYYIFTL